MTDQQVRKCAFCSASFVPKKKGCKLCSLACSGRACGARNRGVSRPERRALNPIAYEYHQGKAEHVRVAESALGKLLPKGAEVHHIDEDKRNNSPSNLVICQSHKYHQLLHARQRIVKAGGNPNRHKLCTDCGLRNKSDFHRDSRAYGGLRPTCKSCVSVQNKIAYQKRITK